MNRFRRGHDPGSSGPAPVLISATAFGQPPLPSAAPQWLEVAPRRSDWGVRGWRHRLVHVRSSLDLIRRSGGREAIVIVHVGIEAMVATPLLRLLRPGTRLVLVDMLLPTDRRLDRVALLPLRLFHRILVLRSGDRDALAARARVDPGRVRFIPYAVRVGARARAEGGYVYSGGAAHRDWRTALAAFERAGVPAVVATSAASPQDAPANVDLRPTVSPEEGRALAADAAVVAIVMHDTDLPAGPLVLMDAMAMGQAVVASNVNGTRDYVEDGVDGVLVPPADPVALADALRRLFEDREEARRLGAAARAKAEAEWTPERFLERLAEELEDLGVELHG